MNELTIPQEFSLAPANFTEADIASVVTTATYFQRLQLMGSNSKLVKQGKFPMGHYALVIDKDTMKDVGDQLDVLACAFRFRAMDISDEDNMINVYDPHNPEFTRIREQAAVADSGCLCGLDFLLWLPLESKFVTFYMASKSALRVAPELRAKIKEKDNKPGPANLSVKLIETKKYSWHAPQVSNCTTPFEDLLPSPEDFIDALKRFHNPESDEVAPQVAESRDR
jgi:hypothetical protein